VDTRFDLQRDIPQGLADDKGTLTRLKGAVKVPHYNEIVGHKGSDPPQPTVIVEGLGEVFGYAEVVEDPLLFSEREERIAQVKPEIDGLLTPGATLREVLQGAQGLLKGHHRLAVGRACGCFDARLPAVLQGLIPHLTADSVMGEPLDLLGRAVGIQGLEHRYNLGVQGTPPLL
jgi:hypothetical protein